MATDFLDPNGTNEAAGGGCVPVGAETLHEATDDAVRQPAAPNTSDYADFEAGPDSILMLALGTREVQSVSEVKVWVHYTVQASVGETSDILVDIAPGGFTTGVPETIATVGDTEESAWASGTFSGLNLSQADLDGLEVEVRIGNNTDVHRVNAIYAEITYAGVAGGSSGLAARIGPYGLGSGPIPAF